MCKYLVFLQKKIFLSMPLCSKFHLLCRFCHLDFILLRMKYNGQNIEMSSDEVYKTSLKENAFYIYFFILGRYEILGPFSIAVIIDRNGQYLSSLTVATSRRKSLHLLLLLSHSFRRTCNYLSFPSWMLR